MIFVTYKDKVYFFKGIEIIYMVNQEQNAFNVNSEGKK